MSIVLDHLPPLKIISNQIISPAYYLNKNDLPKLSSCSTGFH